jgi:hypothetical protein
MTIIMPDGRIIRDGQVDWLATLQLAFQKTKTNPMFDIPINPCEAMGNCNYCSKEHNCPKGEGNNGF